jgi:hypothetical protein
VSPNLHNLWVEIILNDATRPTVGGGILPPTKDSESDVGDGHDSSESVWKSSWRYMNLVCLDGSIWPNPILYQRSSSSRLLCLPLAFMKSFQTSRCRHFTRLSQEQSGLFFSKTKRLFRTPTYLFLSSTKFHSWCLRSIFSLDLKTIKTSLFSVF